MLTHNCKVLLAFSLTTAVARAEAQAVHVDSSPSCYDYLSHALVAPHQPVLRPGTSTEFDTAYRIINQWVPRSMWIGSAADDFSPRPSGQVHPVDSIIVALGSRGTLETDSAHIALAAGLARVLRGDSGASELQRYAASQVYTKLDLPPEAAEDVANDLSLSVMIRASALEALESAVVDSSLVRAHFLTICQLASWASGVPLLDDDSMWLEHALTPRFSVVLDAELRWLAGRAASIRPLAPCKSMEACFGEASSLYRWMVRYRSWVSRAY